MTKAVKEKWYVYRGVNQVKKQIYYGVSKDPKWRIDGSHCVGGTKAIKHWDCANDKITWTRISEHDNQPAASKAAHALENEPPTNGFTPIKTGGI